MNFSGAFRHFLLFIRYVSPKKGCLPLALTREGERQSARVCHSRTVHRETTTERVVSETPFQAFHFILIVDEHAKQSLLLVRAQAAQASMVVCVSRSAFGLRRRVCNFSGSWASLHKLCNFKNEAHSVRLEKFSS